MENVKKKHPISISEVKELLQSQEPDTMDQIQRWTYDMPQNLQNLMLRLLGI